MILKNTTQTIFSIVLLCYFNAIQAQSGNPYKNLIYQDSITYVILDSNEMVMNQIAFNAPLLDIKKPTMNTVIMQSNESVLKNYDIELLNLYLPQSYRFDIAQKNNHLLSFCSDTPEEENGLPALITFSLIHKKDTPIWKEISSKEKKIKYAKSLSELSTMCEWLVRLGLFMDCTNRPHCKQSTIRPILKKGTKYYECLSDKVLTEFFVLINKTTLYPVQQLYCAINTGAETFTKKELQNENDRLQNLLNNPRHGGDLSIDLYQRIYLNNIDIQKSLHCFYHTSPLNAKKYSDYGCGNFIYHPNIGIVSASYGALFYYLLAHEKDTLSQEEQDKLKRDKMRFNRLFLYEDPTDTLPVPFRAITLNGKPIDKRYIPD